MAESAIRKWTREKMTRMQAAVAMRNISSAFWTKSTQNCLISSSPSTLMLTFWEPSGKRKWKG